jgi:hypothetical protein
MFRSSSGEEEVPMSSTLSLTQSEFSCDRLPIKRPAKATILLLATEKNEPVMSKQPSPVTRGLRALVRALVTFCIGVVAALAWQAHGGAVRLMIASSSSQLGWLAPQAAPAAQTASDASAPAALSPDQLLKAALLDLAAVRQSIDQLTASQDQITRTVGQFAAAQEQMTRDVTALQATNRYILYKMSAPLQRPELAPARKPGLRPAPRTTGAGPNAHHAAMSSTSARASSPAPARSARRDAGHLRTRSSAADIYINMPTGTIYSGFLVQVA